MEHAQVLRSAVEGSDEALGALVRTYHDRVYRFGRRVCRDHFDADDAVQEAFIKLARRPDIQRDITVLSWLMTVVRNTCLRMMRGISRAVPRLSERSAEDGFGITEQSPESLFERWQLVNGVHRAIAALPSDYRQVLLLRDIEGLSGEEVATSLQISEAAMKTRLHRARAMMREQLTKQTDLKPGSN
jgi:RNA polymerase sigma-70 factor (ECF subfamily)